MSEFPTRPARGRHETPAFEHALVADAMHPGVIFCPPDASLRTVAAIMATNHVHAVLVTAGGEAPIGVVSERRLVAAAGEDVDGVTVAPLAENPATIFANDPLPHATAAMTERGVNHLVVVDAGGRPLGMLSALDIAHVLASGPPPEERGRRGDRVR
jgi:CBS domain-containing protein